MNTSRFKISIRCRFLCSIMLLIILLIGQLTAQDQETPTTSDSSQLAKDLIGTWILAGRPGNVVDEPEVIGGELKFIAGGYWCVTQADPNGNVMIHHGGTYTLNGDEYVEHVEYATDYTSYLVNTSNTFKIKIEGDTLTQVGIGNRWTQVRKRLNRPLTVGNYEKDTPSLSVAVTMDDIELVKSLISEETDPNTKNAALQKACSVGNLDIVKLLIDNGADVNAKDDKGMTPLLLAVSEGHADVVEFLIEKGADVNTSNGSGFTPLVYALWNSNPNVVKLLLDKGADVNAKDTALGFSVLHWAILMDNKESAELVLAAGADVNGKSSTGETPLDVAAYGVSVSIGELLLAKGAEVSSLHAAAYIGDLAKVKAFIDEGADVKQQKGMIESTALHAAAAGGRNEVVEFLIRKGSDVNARNRASQTPLHLAAGAGHQDIVQLLVKNGADVNVKGRRGQTPLDLAKQRGYTQIVEMLKKHGAKETSQTEGNQNLQVEQSIRPTHPDEKYGEHVKQAFDLYLVDSNEPTPLFIWIHGGGFSGGDKRGVNTGMIERFAQHGVSFASMNYRLTDVGPYPMQMLDAARGLQTIRYRAKQYNIDPTRIACGGGSAGAGISMWLLYHDDLADKTSNDPIARQSTRITCAVSVNGQTSYDPRAIQKLFDTNQISEAFLPFFNMKNDKDLNRPELIKLFEEASIINHATADDPPLYLFYRQANRPLPTNSTGLQHIHHPKFGPFLKDKTDKLGLEVVLKMREDYESANPNKILQDQVDWVLKHFGIEPKKAD